MHKTVLVVEDEALIADDLQRTLERLGYRVPETAATGKDALRLVDALRPALVLMDIKLQGKMDGIEAAHTIRASHGIPVVFLTSHSDEGTLSRAKLAEPYGYLLKPFDERELRTAIEVALHKHGLESQLASRERWFATTLASIGDAVIATDRSEVITFLNAVAERITGWKAADAIGRPLSEVLRLVSPAGVPLESPAQVAFREQFAVQLPVNSALVMRDGQHLNVDDSAAPMFDDKGQLVGAVVVFRDVTERRKLEQRLAGAERLASLGSVAAGMGHEINNPMAVVVTNVSFAQDSIEATIALLSADGMAGVSVTQSIHELRSALDSLLDAARGANRVQKIVHDLRRFARVEERELQTLDLPDLIDSALQLTAHEIRHHARITKHMGTTPYVMGDEGQLVQVLANILINASQAVGDGAARDNEIRISTWTDHAGRAVLEIRDTGPGIAPEVLPRIFDPFFTTKRIGEGMGLGLAIAHSLIGAVGGEITVASTLGNGAAFQVSLPGARQVLRDAAAKPTLAHASRSRILVVDDEPLVLRSLQRILGKQHDVDIADNGADALALIARRPYDLILSDLMMPNMSGVDLYESVAAANVDQGRRFVFMTGGAFGARAREFLESNPNRHILKPFTAKDIRAVVAEALRFEPGA